MERVNKPGKKTAEDKKTRVLSNDEIISAHKETYDKFIGFSQSEIKNAKKFTLDGLITRCFCTKVYDGDTIHLSVPLFGDVYKFACRMYGYNSAEMRPKHDNPEENKAEKEKAIAARDYLGDLILGKYVIAQFMPEEKYGRALANIYLVADDDASNQLGKTTSIVCINKTMIENGHGISYYGSGKKEY